MLHGPNTTTNGPTLLADADVAPLAALLGDRARAAMLWALSDGRALPAGELARVGQVGAPAASAHLASSRQRDSYAPSAMAATDTIDLSSRVWCPFSKRWLLCHRRD